MLVKELSERLKAFLRMREVILRWVWNQEEMKLEELMG